MSLTRGDSRTIQPDPLLAFRPTGVCGILSVTFLLPTYLVFDKYGSVGILPPVFWFFFCSSSFSDSSGSLQFHFRIFLLVRRFLVTRTSVLLSNPTPLFQPRHGACSDAKNSRFPLGRLKPSKQGIPPPKSAINNDLNQKNRAIPCQFERPKEISRKSVIPPSTPSVELVSSPTLTQNDSREKKKNLAYQIARFGAYPSRRIFLAVRVQKFPISL